MTAETFTCPVCGRTSWNPNDVRFGYCGACHAFTGPDTARLLELRGTLLARPELRAGAEDTVAAMLAELAPFDDDDPAPGWIPPHYPHGEPFTVGEIRARLRTTLADLARADERPSS